MQYRLLVPLVLVAVAAVLPAPRARAEGVAPREVKIATGDGMELAATFLASEEEVAE